MRCAKFNRVFSSAFWEVVFGLAITWITASPLHATKPIDPCGDINGQVTRLIEEKTQQVVVHESTYLGSDEDIEYFKRWDGDLESFYNLQRDTSAAEAARRNENVLEQLSQQAMPTRSILPTQKAGLEKNEIEELFRSVKDMDVVKMSACGSYKGKGRELGYCYGHAMGAHLKAIQQRLTPQSIRKVWALGSMNAPNRGNWRFHVATIVRANDGSWHAIDPYFDKPMPIREWYSILSSFSDSWPLRVYSTPANRFSPTRDNKYENLFLKDSRYHQFFVDLMAEVRSSYPPSKSQKPPIWPTLKNRLDSRKKQ